MTIHIEDLKFQCIIGILDFERIKPQDIIVNIQLDYTYIEKFINYADLSNLIKSQMKNEKFLLIEDALNYFTKKLKEEFPLIENLYIKITKPSILPECRVSVSNSLSFNS